MRCSSFLGFRFCSSRVVYVSQLVGRRDRFLSTRLPPVGRCPRYFRSSAGAGRAPGQVLAQAALGRFWPFFEASSSHTASSVSPEGFCGKVRAAPLLTPPSSSSIKPCRDLSRSATLFMNENLIVLAILGLFFAGIVKGATGIGYSSCALPFLAAALDIKAAIVLLVVPAMASNAAVLCTTGSLAAALKRFWPLYIATLPGIFLGAALLAVVDKRIPTQILGIVISAYSIQAWLKPSFTLRPGFSRAVQVPVGLINGLLTGLTGSQVMPLMPYMMALRLEPGLFVQAINIAVVIASAFLGLGLWATGTMSAPRSRPIHPCRGAGPCRGSAWVLGQAACPRGALPLHRARRSHLHRGVPFCSRIAKTCGIRRTLRPKSATAPRCLR